MMGLFLCELVAAVAAWQLVKMVIPLGQPGPLK